MVSAGSVSLRVRPDTSQFFQDLSAQLRARGTSAVSVPIQIDRSSIASYRAQVANLTRPVTLPVLVQLDRQAQAQYRAQLANLTRAQQVDINVRLRGESEARARLAQLAQNRTANVRVDTDRGAASTIGRITSAAGSAVGAVGSLVSKVALLGGSAPLVGSLVNVVAAIAPAAALAVPAVVALGSAAGAIKLGTSGLGDAFKEAFEPAATGAAKAVSATNAVANAQRSLGRAQTDLKRTAQDTARAISDAQERVKDAQQGVKDAEVQAARQRVQAARAVQDAQRSLRNAVEAAAEAQKKAAQKVADAERDLLEVKKDALRAEESLADARKQAAQDLLDLQSQLTQSALDERDAQLNLQEAQEELDKVKARGALATQRDLDEAQLRYDQAVFSLKRQQEGHKALQQQADEASKAGVDGSDRVKDAQDRLSKAQQAVADKAKTVKDAETEAAKARRDAAESVADAQQNLKDAQQAQADAAVEGARRIKDAQDSVKDSQQGVTDAQVAGARAMQDAQHAVADASRAVAEAQRAQSEQTAALTEKFAKLSPNAQAFVNAVKGLKPAWDSMQLGVQDRLFAGLGGRLTDVGSRALPILRGGLEGTAGVLNRMAHNALTAVDNLARTGMLKQIFDGATKSLSPLSRLPGQLVTGFGQVAIAAQPAFQRITEGLAGAADGVFAKLTKAFESGAMEKAIDQAVTLLGDLMDVAGNVFSILGDIFMAGEGTGGGTIQVLKEITGAIAEITSSPEVQAGLKALFSVMGTIATTVAPLLGTALKFVGQIFEKLGPPVEVLVRALGDALTPVIDALGPVLVILAGVLGDILVAISPLIVVIGELLATALKPLGPIFEVIGDLIVALAPTVSLLADALGQMLTPILEGLGTVLVTLARESAAQFMEILKQLLPVIPELIPPLVEVGKSLGDLLLAIAPLLPQIVLLGAQLLTTLLPAILPLLPPTLQLIDLLVRLAVWAIKRIVLPAIQGLIDFVKDMGRKLQPFIDAVKHVTEWIAKKFQWLYDKLVGNSIIPDLIKKIRDWFNTGKRWIKEIWNAVWENTIGHAVSAGRTVGEKVAGFARGVRDRFNDAKRWVSERWNSLWSGISERTTSMRKTVEGKVRDFKDNVVGFFKKAIEGIKTAWDKLQDVAKKPVKFMIETVFNKGIVGVWNATAAKLPGIGKINEMKLPRGFASGGVLPGYSPGKDIHRFVSPTGGMLDLSGGEAIMRPEVTRVMGRSGVETLNAAARQGGVQGVRAVLARGIPHQAFFGGGIFGDIWDKVTDNPVTDKVKDVVGKGVDWARGGLADLAEKAFKALLGTLSVPTLKDAKWADAVKAVPVSLADKIVDFIRGKEAEVGGGGSWTKPVNAAYGTKFGVKGHMWSSGYHTGLDFPAAVGTAIKAVAAGRISSVGRTGPYGNHLTIDHGGGLSSLYAHMSQIVAKAKENVAAGSLIGKVGATGNTTGPHLHLEARVNGKTVDPMPYLTEGGSALNTPGSGVKRWAGVVRQALSLVGQPSSLVDTTLRRMNQESGGNPRAVNLWDSNAKAGHPSVGLMQVIGPTFRAYAGRFKNKGPFLYGTSIDPLANVYSSMRYALSAYGSLSRAYNRPGGYDQGGWLPPGITPVVNETGVPEAILNPQQWDAMITLANQVKQGQAGGGGHNITINSAEPTTEKKVADAIYRMELLGR
ncbi:peptidoglycan DD-metalloendopeptidase family protein [Streptomyces hirsutus]|uniref:Peptidoglycan DD-metalloendopeptidase family protein n=1 Tax=Streptomyces hirsutus TaxID=35620 RepID=A0ABZ1GVU1_9ACTN|nr:peptidoglycan DD-metalloendopeptidase family protein [Streptomyces hirsutus]WSD09321.1 peptidoglycan DD-metalloendopeptidase family protein [Streptomyces hirsutus]